VKDSREDTEKGARTKRDSEVPRKSHCAISRPTYIYNIQIESETPSSSPSTVRYTPAAAMKSPSHCLQQLHNYSISYQAKSLRFDSPTTTTAAAAAAIWILQVEV
jgi:hypothetical protein